MRIPLLFLICFLVTQIKSQNIDSLQIESWFSSAENYLLEDQLDSFDHYNQKVFQGLEQNNDLAGWIEKRKKFAKLILIEKNQAAEALTYLEPAFVDNLFRYPESDLEWQNLGYLYVFSAYLRNEEFQEYDLAEKDYSLARQILVDCLGENDGYIAEFLLLPLSEIYTKKGDYTAAEALVRKFYNIFMEEGNYPMAASALSNLSIIYRDLEKYDQAIRVCKKGIEMKGADEVALGLLNSNLAQSLYLSSQNEEGLIAAAEASRYFNILRDYDWWKEIAEAWLAVNLGLTGDIHSSMGDFNNANINFGEAELLFNNLYDNKYSRDYGKLYQAWGMSKIAEGDYNGGLELFQESLKSMLPLFKAENPILNPNAKDLYAENTLMEALQGKAIAFGHLFDQVNQVEYLEAALECHELIFEVEKLLRQSYYFEKSKLYNIEESRERCEHAISICLKLAKEKKDPSYNEKAFEFAELSKSVLLLEAFLKNNSINNLDLPEDLKLAEQSLLKEIAAEQEELYNLESAMEPDSVQIQEKRESLYNLKKQFADWMAEISVQHKAYYDNRFNETVVSVSEIQQKLVDGNTSLLEYFVGKESIHLFVVNKDDFQVLELTKAPSLEEDIARLLQSIGQYSKTENAAQLCSDYTRLGQELFDFLLGVAEEKKWLKKDVIVIPSGQLALLPFDVLLAEKPEKECQFNSYPYALHKYNFSYGYSATLQYRLNELPSIRNGELLGFGPAFNGSSNWGKLKDNVALLEELQKEWKGIYELNDSATISRLEHALLQGAFEIIHFSTHAEANTEKGDFSFIVFADGDGGYDSLYVNDIYQLKVLSDLVILGACETAQGTLHKGEGVISLARAFLQTGSRSVLTTLWSVYDGTNKKVLLDFYANLDDGLSKSEALRQAKIARTKLDSRSAHPVFWAAYTPYGDMGGIRKEKIPAWALFLAGGLFLYFMAMMIRSRAKRLAREL